MGEKKETFVLDNNNIKWSRPNPLKWKDNNGNEHMYYPDFYIPSVNLYIEYFGRNII